MKVRWEKRYNKYYAYLRDSKSVNGKTVTTNVYLGMDMFTAKQKLHDYLHANKIPIGTLERELHMEGVSKGVPINLKIDENTRNQQIDKLYELIRDQISQIPDAKTKEVREKLANSLAMNVIEYHNALRYGEKILSI